MRFGKTRFYADEDIDQRTVVTYLRRRGYRVESAKELGFSGRDDRFHLQEAKRRGCVLISEDVGYLNHRRFPFSNLNDTAIVVLRSDSERSVRESFGYLLANVADEIGKSGNKNLFGFKFEVRGSRTTLYARVRGAVRSDVVDLRDHRS